MNRATLIRKGLLRHRIRFALLVISVFSAFLLFGMLMALNSLLHSGIDEAASDVLIVTSRSNLVQPLPIAHVERVRSVDGVAAASGETLLAGTYQQARNLVILVAIDPLTFFTVRRELDIRPDQLAAFTRERQAALVGEAVAKQYNIHVGDRLTIGAGKAVQVVGAKSWDFVVRGIVASKFNGSEGKAILFNYEYLNEARPFNKDTVGVILVRTKHATLNDQVANRIDSRFANSAAETRTLSEEAFGRAFIAQLGNIALIVTLVVAASLVSILLIISNMTYLSVRERTREFAVMKTLGFAPSHILGLVLSEALTLSLIGGALGLATAALAAKALAHSGGLTFAHLAVSPTIMLQGMVLMVGLGLVTGLFPALMAMRLPIARALGRV